MKKIKKHSLAIPNHFTKEDVASRKESQINDIKINDFERIKRLSLDVTESRIRYTHIYTNSTFGFTGLYNLDNYTYNYLYYSNQLTKAFFKYSLYDGQKVSLQIADKTIETVGKFKPTDGHTGAMDVVRGMELAFILRDKEALAFYKTVPFELTEQNAHDDIITEIMLILFRMLADDTADDSAVATTFQQIEANIPWEEFRKYVRKTDFLDDYMWKYLHGHRKEKVDFLYLPLLKIYFYIITKNQKEFEDSVFEALQLWQQYYTKKYVEQGEEFDRSFEPEGYWCIPVISACAFAFDRGMKLETVESDYLCQWMIEGRFEGFELLVKGEEPV